MGKYAEQALNKRGSTRIGELRIIEGLAGKHIKEGGAVCEVGAEYGRSTWLLGNICRDKNATLYVLDKKIRCKRVLRGLPVVFIEGDSTKVHTQVPDDLDFVFVDGDHKMPTVFFDIINFWGKLRAGGIMCGHDYYPDPNSDVKPVVDSLKITSGFECSLEHSIWWKEK